MQLNPHLPIDDCGSLAAQDVCVAAKKQEWKHKCNPGILLRQCLTYILPYCKALVLKM